MAVQLIYVFTYTVNDVVHTSTLVNPMYSETRLRSRKGKALGLHRVHAKPRQDSEFIPIRSIFRGALLVLDSDNPRDFFVVDVVDTDMFETQNHVS